MKDITYNFGAIRDSVARLSSMELIKEDTSQTMESFVSKVSENPNLKKQQLIYKNIQSCKPFEKERLAERFLNQNLSMFKNVDWNQMMFENKQLRKDLLGAPDVSHVEASEAGDLFEAINTLIESVTRRGFADFEAEARAYDSVISHLTREVVEEGEKSEEKDDAPNLGEVWKFLTKMAVNNFNERYDHLNESEKEVLNVLISSNGEKKEFLEGIINENLTIINNLVEDVDKTHFDTLVSLKEKLQRMKESIDTMKHDDCILECIDLKQNLQGLL